MVSSETGGVVDCGVGSIVWVRRRNGSWWPGKILGPEELSSTHITSPRSGTPVKLLGREDASVDWYNLEKSKRVKAFRCGQFDDSIEKAEATQGMPPKKREKYARREDAILHALELERQLLGKSYGPSNGTLRNSPEAVTSSGYFEHGAGNQKNPRTEGCERLARSLIEKNASDQHQHAERVREVNPHSGDDDSQGVLPRMRGLQDFGLRTVPPPREELSGVAFRAKRSRYDLPYDSGDSSNDNRLQLSLIEVPVSKHEESGSLANAGEDHISGSTEDTETDCSETDSLESDSDDEMDALSDGSASIELQPKYPRTDRHKEEGSSSSSDDVDEFTDDAFHPYSNDFPSTSTGVSKWQLKRKRNTRSLGNRSLNRTDSEVFRRNSNWSASYLNADLSDKSPRNHIPRYGSKGLHGSGNDINDFPGFTWNNNHSAIREYWEPSREFADPLFSGKQHFGGSGMLVEVDLKVQASNYRRDVPLISLTSKLNGHAIVGHPIQVEPLENGSTEHLFAATDYIFHESLESPNTLPQAWRTGRRTANFRVPRPQFVEPEKKLPFGSEYGNSGPKANSAKKSYNQYPVDGSFSRSSPKKVNLSSNQKIRTLSSIASEPKHQGDLRIGGGNYQVEGLIKTESVPTTVACIPVNLVFSRLNEELAGHK